MMTKRSSRTTPLATPPSPITDVAQRAIVHVDRARPRDAARIDVERVALLQMVVEHRATAAYARCDDRVEVAGEVQVDVLHRQHLRVAAAGRAALHAEDRAERSARACRARRSCRCGRSACARPTRWCVFPSPAAVGLIAVTSTRRPLRWALRDLEVDLRLVLAVEVELVRRRVRDRRRRPRSDEASRAERSRYRWVRLHAELLDDGRKLRGVDDAETRFVDARCAASAERVRTIVAAFPPSVRLGFRR